MNLSSLTDSLRSRFASFNPLARPTPQPTAVSNSHSPAAGADTKVELGGREEDPAVYDRFGQLNGKDSASTRQQANDKVLELKKRMKWLKSMMVGASPAQRKALARQLGQIANELKAAVKNFAEASGSAPNSTKPTNTVASADPSALPAKPQTDTAASPADPLTAHSAANGKPQATPEAANSGQGGNKEKQDFVRDAKELAGDIKRTLETLKRKLRRQSDSVVRHTEKALGDIGKMLDKLGSGASLTSTGGSTPALNIQATVSASGAGNVSSSATSAVGS